MPKKKQKKNAEDTRGIFEKNKAFFITFFALLIYYNFFMLDSPFQAVNGAAYAFHAVDFSLGFCTKLLPGAIYRLLVGKYNEAAMTVYVNAVSIIILLLMSILAQKIYLRSANFGKGVSAAFLVLFSAAPFTFYYVLQFQGCLDSYWVIVFLLSVLCLNHKIFRWAIPFLSFVLILVHEGAILFMIPLLVFILILKLTSLSEQKERKSYLIILLLTAAVSIAATGYFLLTNGTNFRFADMKELDSFLESRGVKSFLYYEWSFFGRSDEAAIQQDSFPSFMFSESGSAPVQLFFRILRQIYYTVTTSNYITPLPQIIYSFPVCVLLIYCIIRFIKSSQKKLDRLTGICFCLLPLFTFVSGILFSNDVLRWFSHAVLTLFGGFISLIFLRGEECFKPAEGLMIRFKTLLVPYMLGFPLLML